MKTVSVLTVLALAGGASAQVIDAEPRLLDPSEYTITATTIDSGEDVVNPMNTVLAYTGIPGPYTAVAAGAFSHRDDYTVGAPLGANNRLFSLRFVGGVTAVNGTLEFFFLDSGALGGTPTVVSSFAVPLSMAGNFIWTITFNPASRPTLLDSGGLQIQTRAGTTGQWFFTTTAPTVGTNDIAVGTGSGLNPQRNQAFEIVTIPAPGALALIGLGGLVAVRRKR